MTTALDPYQKLCARMREIALVNSSASLLSWDQETYMPPKALPHRAEQMAFLSGWTHRQFTAPEVGDWLSARRFNARRAVRVLQRLTSDPQVADACRQTAQRFVGVDALGQTCDLLESLAVRPRPTPPGMPEATISLS